MTGVQAATSALLTGLMLFYAVLVVMVLIRAVAGPKVADRLMAINMIGTVVIFLMAVVAVKLDEDYLLDISIIYAMISFLAVVILTKVYMGVHEENVRRKKGMDTEELATEEDELDRLLREMEK